VKKFFFTYLSYFLYPLTFLYRLLFALNQARKQSKEIPDSFVISVGNLSVGGTGKTPFTLYLLEVLQNLKLPLCVLSRGYKGKLSKNGMRVLVDSLAIDCGDEPLLIKKKFSQVEVIIGKDRLASYFKYYPNPSEKKIIILEDGFQHKSIQRNLDFVLIDSQTLLGKGWTLPAGLLREPITALRRANFVVFTKYEVEFKQKVEEFQFKLQKDFPHLSFLKMFFIPSQLKNYLGEVLSLTEFSNFSWFAFSGVGNFDSFYRTVLGLNSLDVQFQAFEDHYNFQEKDVLQIFKKKPNRLLVCTEKDFVKFSSWIDTKEEYKKIWYLEMKTKLDISDEDFLEKIKKYIS
jgi:tetraacyldisaccharide 4'-kinase